MFRLIGCVFRMIRWLILVGLLLLIVQLLLVDPAERRPVLQQLTGQVVEGARMILDRVMEFRSVDPSADSAGAGPEADTGSTVGSWTGLHRPPRAGWNRESGLPSDFLSELEQAVVRSPDPEARARWSELAAADDRAAQIQSAVQLARWLPEQWWAVDGRLVHELDLPNVLGKKRHD